MTNWATNWNLCVTSLVNGWRRLGTHIYIYNPDMPGFHIVSRYEIWPGIRYSLGTLTNNMDFSGHILHFATLVSVRCCPQLPEAVSYRSSSVWRCGPVAYAYWTTYWTWTIDNVAPALSQRESTLGRKFRARAWWLQLEIGTSLSPCYRLPFLVRMISASWSVSFSSNRVVVLVKICVNCCRNALHLLFLSDIVTADDAHLEPWALLDLSPRQYTNWIFVWISSVLSDYTGLETVGDFLDKGSGPSNSTSTLYIDFWNARSR